MRPRGSRRGIPCSACKKPQRFSAEAPAYLRFTCPGPCHLAAHSMTAGTSSGRAFQRATRLTSNRAGSNFPTRPAAGHEQIPRHLTPINVTFRYLVSLSFSGAARYTSPRHCRRKASNPRSYLLYHKYTMNAELAFDKLSPRCCLRRCAARATWGIACGWPRAPVWSAAAR